MFGRRKFQAAMVSLFLMGPIPAMAGTASPSSSQALTAVVILFAGIVFWIVAFLVLRAVVLWYWKIDQIAASLKNIENVLAEKAKIS